MLFYAVCSPTFSRLNRKNVGEKAIWHPDFCLWLFRDRIDAELVANAYSDKKRSFCVHEIACPAIERIMSSDARVRNIERLHAKLIKFIDDLIHMRSKYDVACHSLKINPEDVTDHSTGNGHVYLKGLLSQIIIQKNHIAETKNLLKKIQTPGIK